MLGHHGLSNAPLSSLAGTIWTASLSDTVTLADAEAMNFGKALADSLTLSDALVNAFGKALEDSFSLADVRVANVGKPVSDSVTLSDGISKSYLQALADSLSLTDEESASIGKALSDAFTLTDALGKTIGHILADSMTLTDARAAALGKTLADAMSLDDALAKAIGKALEDDMALTDFMSSVISTPLTPLEISIIYEIMGVPENGNAYIVYAVATIMGAFGQAFDFSTVVAQLAAKLAALSAEQITRVRVCTDRWQALETSQGAIRGRTDYRAERRSIRNRLAGVIGFAAPQDGFLDAGLK
jgi:hypothetical protein